MNYKSPHACTLALQLVKEHYGELPEMVCRRLIQHGQQTLQDLSRGVQCARPLLKEALLLLLQQNCLNCYLQVTEATIRSPSSSTFVYEVAVGSICQTLRNPRFLMHVRDESGELPELVVECLLEHGRLRVEQIVSQVASKMDRDVDAIRGEVIGALTSVVHSRYVERVPPATLPVPERKLFTSKPISKAAQAETAVERSRREAPHAAYQKDRFRLPSDLYDYLETGMVPGQVPAAGEKRRASDANHNGGGADGSNLNNDSISSLLWRVNADEFNRRFRHAKCVSLVRQKMDAECADVVEVMLSFSRNQETSVQEATSRPVNINEIRSGLERKAAGTGESDAVAIDAAALLQEMSQDPLELVAFSGDTAYGATYQVNMQRIVDIVKLKEMEGVVKERFGIPALRIFRLLFQRHQLEQKQIAEMVMSPIKETRELLYNMLKAGLITMQEVPKTSDHAPSRTFFLWRIDLVEASARLASELYKAAANIRLRFAAEQNKEKDVLERFESNRDLTTTERNRLIRMKNVAETLDASLMHLDELIAIFNEF